MDFFSEILSAVKAAQNCNNWENSETVNKPRNRYIAVKHNCIDRTASVYMVPYSKAVSWCPGLHSGLFLSLMITSVRKE